MQGNWFVVVFFFSRFLTFSLWSCVLELLWQLGESLLNQGIMILTGIHYLLNCRDSPIVCTPKQMPNQRAEIVSPFNYFVFSQVIYLFHILMLKKWKHSNLIGIKGIQEGQLKQNYLFLSDFLSRHQKMKALIFILEFKFLLKIQLAYIFPFKQNYLDLYVKLSRLILKWTDCC